jgi:CMP-N-acetylneuraminic acid synthetase
MSGRVAALIPARSGSKGLVGKNVRLLNGRPLIDYVIKSALESNVDEVWVSTDCDEIGDVAIESGAKVIKRPDSIALDSSPVDEAILHFAECVPNFEKIVMLQCTSPLTLSSDIDDALAFYNNNPRYDTVLSVCDSTGGFQCGGYHWEDTGNDHCFRTTTYYPCRQHAPERFKENGALYVISRKTLLQSKKKIAGQVGVFKMPRHRSFEIDYLDEFEELEELLKCGFIDRMNEKGSTN